LNKIGSEELSGGDGRGHRLLGKTTTILVMWAMAAGCARHDMATVPPGQNDVPDLVVAQPRSGGEMVLLPAGSFTMGDDRGSADEKPPHTARVSSFYMDRYPVTQELYEKIMGTNPSKKKGGQLPVERVQWTEAARFCNKCSELEGLAPWYDPKTWECRSEAGGFRLPTEAEWEYACRAGSTARYGSGDSDSELVKYAWFKPHSGGMTHSVGQKAPNRWGLFDMHGNVWQWCNDFYAADYYQHSPNDNPPGPAQGQMRVLRGGAWDCPAEKCRSAYRHKEYPVYADACFGADSYGFRRARTAIQLAEKKLLADAEPPAPSPPANREASRARAPVPATPVEGSVKLSGVKGTIVFVSDRTGTLKIWKMHASGKQLKQLTHSVDADADPRFSPDGKQIIYTSLRGGFPELWLVDRDGSSARFVAKGSQADWSPDGRSLLFIRDNQAYVRNLASGSEARVTPAAWERCGVPAWSPDGKRIAVASRHLQNVGVFLLSLDGKDIQQLGTQEPCCTPRWSRDGKHIACQSVQGHIHQIDADGKNWEQLTYGADVQHDACYSPDGTMIAFCRAPAAEGPWQICVKKLDSDDLDFVQLTHESSNLLPDWHPSE
jgi:formylglycine-generating enzyme required for sulfatase activity